MAATVSVAIERIAQARLGLDSSRATIATISPTQGQCVAFTPYVGFYGDYPFYIGPYLC
jgi:hypothetical protein